MQERKADASYDQDTGEHIELKNLSGDIKSYNLMMGQLRTKIAHLDFAKHRERIFLEKLALINQTKKDDLTMLNKENMQLSYEIDELIDRVRTKQMERMKNKSPSKGGLDDIEKTLNKNASLNSSIKKRNFNNSSVNAGHSASKLDEKVPLLDPTKFS